MQQIEAIAWDLYHVQGLNWKQIHHHLTKEEGVSELEARELIERLQCIETDTLKHEEELSLIREQEEELHEILREDKDQSPLERAQRKISIGIGLIIIGIIMLIVILMAIPGRFIRYAIVLIFIGGGLISQGIYHKKVIFERNREK